MNDERAVGSAEKRNGEPASDLRGAPDVDAGTRAWWSSGTAIVVWIALATVALHLATGWRYGFDRDELMALEDARHLAWGYVQYPPMTAFFGRVALSLFGTSLVGFRVFAALVMALAVVLTGLMAKQIAANTVIRNPEFGSLNERSPSPNAPAPKFGEWAMIVAALAAVPFCLGGGALMQYIAFDYVCWVLVAYCMVRVSATVDESPRGAGKWWLGVGVAIGLGMMAKYTMGFFVAGVVVGVLLTPMRRYLKSGWPWLGVLLACLIFLPNFLWQWHRNFISLEFFRFLHSRDVATGQTDWFLLGQVEVTLLAFPLAAGGLYFCLFAQEGKRYRILGWMYAVPLVLFLLLRGRDYYLAPAYPMLYAAGAVWLEKKWRDAREHGTVRWLRPAVWLALTADVLLAGAVTLPIAPIQSQWWKFAVKVDSVFAEEIGWPEFVETVAQVRDGVPLEERARLAILAGNYGEVGALNLYGDKYGLPRAISGVNSSWERGFGAPGPEPETVIVVGYPRAILEKHFTSVDVAAHTGNRFGVANEETVEDPDIFVCRGLKESWEEFWKKMKKYA